MGNLSAFTSVANAIPRLFDCTRRAICRRTNITASYTSTSSTDASSALSKIVTLANTAAARINANEWLHMSDAEVAEVKDALSLIDAQSLGVERSRFPLRPGDIAYVEVGASRSVTLAVFALAEGASLPLHNHPGMFVFTKVLWGNLGVESYDLLPDEGVAQRNEDYIVESGDSIVLTPTLRNVHAFSAVHGPVAIFDVVCPPYTDIRPCSYIRPENAVQVGKKVRLRRIPTPDDLYMDSFRYNGVRFKL